VFSLNFSIVSKLNSNLFKVTIRTGGRSFKHTLLRALTFLSHFSQKYAFYPSKIYPLIN
jgi:hypothetical protein